MRRRGSSVRRTNPDEAYENWCRLCAAFYYEYKEKLCEGYRSSHAKYALCVKEKACIGISKENLEGLKNDLIFLWNCLKTVLNDYAGYFEARFAKGLSTRKYAEDHSLNRGSVDHPQRKSFTALAQTLKERDEAEGRSRLQESCSTKAPASDSGGLGMLRLCRNPVTSDKSRGGVSFCSLLCAIE